MENKVRSLKLMSNPMTLQIEPTNRCNLSCKQCFRYDPASKRQVGDMTYKSFLKIMKQFPNVFEVSLIGLGESFLNNDLHKMIGFLGEKKIDVSLTTNGTVFDTKIIDAINGAKKVYIQFSLDAATDDTYKKIRGVRRFDQVIHNIQRFMEYKGDHVSVSLGLVVMQDNLSELQQFIRLADKLKIKRIHFGDLSGSWLSDNRSEIVVCGNNDFLEKVKKATQTAYKLGIDLKYNKYEYIWEDQASLTHCWFLWQYPYITWDGYVTSCCNLPNPEINNFGNIIQKPFSEIWNNSAYRNFRKQLKNGNPHILCRSCHLAN
jgi:MoaA/NifB/PqqE/SkfB family radical SAM enzyme